MDFQDLIKDLENTQEYKDFIDSHSNAYLAHIFVMLDDANKDTPQVGYYDPDLDRVTTFIIEPSKIMVAPDQEIAKRPGQTVEPLDISKVEKRVDEIMIEADKIQQEHYKSFPIIKKFFIIQDLEGQIYNVTYFTQQLNTINVKLNMDLSLKDHSIQSLGDFTKEK